MRRRPTALTGVILAIAMGCAALPSPRLVRRDPSPNLRPIERLGRWHEGRFVPVDAAELPPSHLYVLTHGWAPGWGRRLEGNPQLRAWEAIDHRGRRFEQWMHDLAEVIDARDPHAVIVVYSWLDHASTGRFMLAQRQAIAYTELHGRLLAEALDEALGESFFDEEGKTHLIGHSYGARVITVAAIRMDPRPRQLTFFDSPDSAMTAITGGRTRLAELLVQLPIGTGPGEIFVDNYVAMVGTRYRSREIAGIVDVTLNPPYSTLAYRPRHLYPMRFYAESAEHGFGLGWSPLLNAQVPAPGCYRQPYGSIDLEPGCPPSELAAP